MFIKSKYERIEIMYSDKRNISKSLSKGKKILREEEEKYKNSKKFISKKLKHYRIQKNTDIWDLKKYKLDLEAKHLYRSNIVQTKYFINNDGILKDFILVDTPGLNQTLLKENIDKSKLYYKRADGIIWLIDVQNIVSLGSNNAIKKIHSINEDNSLNIYSEPSEMYSSKNMILVVNKIDILKNKDKDDIERIKTQVKSMYKDIFKDIVFISAKNALLGTSLNDESLINESNIEELYNSIDKNFKLTAMKNQIISKYKNLSITGKNIIERIDEYKRRLYKDIFEYNTIELQLKEKTEEIKEYVNKFLNRMEKYEYLKSTTQSQINEDIRRLEYICNKKLEKIYIYLYSRAMFTSGDIEDKNMNAMNNNFRVLFNLNYISKEKLPINIISTKIKYLIDDILEELDYKINLIKNDIDEVKNYNFNLLYLDYLDLNRHINCLDNIEEILRKLG